MNSYRAVLVTFVLTGLVSATWAGRLPATQARLELSTGRLGLVVLAIEAGALIGLPVGGLLVGRYGSRWSLRLGLACFPALLAALAFAPTLLWLATAAAIWAALNSVIDVAMNTAGIEVEAEYGRPLLSSLHAGQSAGLLIGGLGAVIGAALDVPLWVHFAAIAVLCGCLGCLVAGRLPAATSRDRQLGRPDRRLWLPGAVAFCGFLVEGGASNWAAIDLSSQHDAHPAVAAAAYTLFVVMMAVVRYGGDRIVDRYGRARAVRVSAVTAAAGTVLVVVAPTAVSGVLGSIAGVVVAVAGWSIVGAGVALVAPTVLAAAPGLAGSGSRSSAIAAVSTMGYLGAFTGPVLISGVAGRSSLTVALTVLTGAATLTAALARRALKSPAGVR
ncbi:MFS transporter [Kribbella sp. CA-247076]|uniref:MFS transporter n=1 Tax=Kribbella sp. CA-247076 TaxID=3239941 RepID=UPI003D8EB598